jgi:transcriptional regulator GlxA family with amidase domain
VVDESFVRREVCGRGELVNRPKKAAAVGALLAFAEAIRALGSVPSGVFYANVMGSVDLDQYQTAIRTLTSAGLIEVKSDVIRWIGPNFAPAVNS